MKYWAMSVVVQVVVTYALVAFFYGRSEQEGAVASGPEISFERLSDEQKSAVKDSFDLARNLYVQGKYHLCLTELAKLHDVVTQYENSKELDTFCEQGKELAIRQRDLEHKERERALIEQQITGHIENCKTELGPKPDMNSARECLAEAIELDPYHPLIVEMLTGSPSRRKPAAKK